MSMSVSTLEGLGEKALVVYDSEGMEVILGWEPWEERPDEVGMDSRRPLDSLQGARGIKQ